RSPGGIKCTGDLTHANAADIALAENANTRHRLGSVLADSLNRANTSGRVRGEEERRKSARNRTGVYRSVLAPVHLPDSLALQKSRHRRDDYDELRRAVDKPRRREARLPPRTGKPQPWRHEWAHSDGARRGSRLGRRFRPRWARWPALCGKTRPGDGGA